MLPQIIRNAVKAVGREECATATQVRFGDGQRFVQADPAGLAGGFPLAGADGQPRVIISVVVVGGDKEAKDILAVTAYHQHGTLARWGGGDVEPHHLAGLGLAVHVRGIEDAARDFGGGKHLGACGAPMVPGRGVA